jgi:SAM-dependent methyltransferase
MTRPLTERPWRAPTEWFREHFDDAADTIISFLADDGVTLEGKRVADIGCGDGIIDLGLALKASPELVRGFDPRPVDVDALLRSAQAAGIAQELPPNLAFSPSTSIQVPDADSSYDVVVTWSAFEHVSEPVQMFGEIRRLLKPGGVCFLQIWPLWPSQHGGHLWPHFDEPFPHLLRDEQEIEESIRGRQATDPTRTADGEFASLNRLTLADLQRAMMAGGLFVSKLKLLTDTIHIPVQLAHRPLHDLGIGGVQLLALPVWKDGSQRL